jgi:UDP-glucose 4-epimerase
MLGKDVARVVHRIFPDAEALFAARGWKLFPKIDRVYVNDLARADLGWKPKHEFAGDAPLR